MICPMGNDNEHVKCFVIIPLGERGEEKILNKPPSTPSLPFYLLCKVTTDSLQLISLDITGLTGIRRSCSQWKSGSCSVYLLLISSDSYLYIYYISLSLLYILFLFLSQSH